MDIGTALVALTGIGCLTGIICMVIDKVSNQRIRSLEAARHLAEERMALQQQRIADLELHNRQLQQQLDWHARLSLGPTSPGLSSSGRQPTLTGAPDLR